MIDLDSRSTNTYIPFNVYEPEGSICDHKSLNIFPYRLKEYVPLGALHFNWAKYSMSTEESKFSSPYNVHITKEGKPDFIFKSRDVEHTEENILACHYLSMAFFQKYNFFPYTMHPNLKPSKINSIPIPSRIATRFRCSENRELGDWLNIIYTPSGYIYNNDGNCIGFLEIPYELYILMFHRLYSLPDDTIYELHKKSYNYADLVSDIHYSTRIVIDERYDLVGGENTLANYLSSEGIISVLDKDGETKTIYKDVINKVSNIFEYVTGETINIKTKKQIINV